MSEKTIICVVCRNTFTDEETEGFKSCPSCGCKDIPARLEEVETITITLHELRVLFNWSFNWAKELEDMGTEGYRSIDVIRGIIKGIREQKPDMAPLTIEEEVKHLVKEGKVIEISEEQLEDLRDKGLIMGELEADLSDIESVSSDETEDFDDSSRVFVKGNQTRH